ncbi:hypothetical protein AeMF1_005450 [Aphanomyces euteiches]|nr:hypothetical protein AeMF1_005450 [Aphanomyces euteiches]
MTPDGTPKGIKIVLEERGLWNSSLKLNTAKDLLASQPDFKSQKSRVEETIEAAGHIALFLPKFHCEFNFIEMYWGALKYYCRENCDYSFAKLLPTVEAAMAASTVVHACHVGVYSSLREEVLAVHGRLSQWPVK